MSSAGTSVKECSCACRNISALADPNMFGPHCDDNPAPRSSPGTSGWASRQAVRALVGVIDSAHYMISGVPAHEKHAPGPLTSVAEPSDSALPEGCTI